MRLVAAVVGLVGLGLGVGAGYLVQQSTAEEPEDPSFTDDRGALTVTVGRAGGPGMPQNLLPPGIGGGGGMPKLPPGLGGGPPGRAGIPGLGGPKLPGLGGGFPFGGKKK